MNNLLHNIKSAVVGIGLAISSFFGFHHDAVQAPALGTSIPLFVAAKPTFLYGGGISSSANSIKVTALVTPAGAPITTAQLVGGPNQVFYATIEPSTTKKETTSCTGVTQNADGTALLTGCTRGLQFTAPYTASSTLAVSHAGGASLVISNSPQVYNDIVNDSVSLTRNSTTTGQIIFSSTNPPALDANPNFTNLPTTTLATIGFVASTSFSGTVNSSETQKGISELATNLEAASSTSLGSTLARLVLPASLATSSCSVAQFGSVIVSSSTGKAGVGCIDQTGVYSWSGAHTFTASTTLNATTTIAGTAASPLRINGLTYQYPSTRGASSTALQEDGAGNLSWVTTSKCVTGQGSFNGTGNNTINHFLGFTPTYFRIDAFSGGAGGAEASGSYSSGTGTSTASQSSSFFTNIVGAYKGGQSSTLVIHQLYGGASTVRADGSITSMTSTTSVLNIATSDGSSEFYQWTFCK